MPFASVLVVVCLRALFSVSYLLGPLLNHLSWPRGRAKQTMSEPFVSQCREDLQKQREALGGLEEHLPHQTGLLLYLVLGEVNVTLPVMSDRSVQPLTCFILWLDSILFALFLSCFLSLFHPLPTMLAGSSTRPSTRHSSS